MWIRVPPNVGRVGANRMWVPVAGTLDTTYTARQPGGAAILPVSFGPAFATGTEILSLHPAQ